MQDQLVKQLRSLKTQRWRQHAIEELVRSVSVGLLIACIGALLPIVGLGSFPRYGAGWIIAGSVLVGSLRAMMFQLSLATVARRLDRRFGLHEQVSTALELRGNQVGIAARLQAQVQESLDRVQNYVNRTRTPLWSEALTPVSLFFILIGLLVLATPPIPPASTAEPLPDLIRPDPVAMPSDQQPTSPVSVPAASSDPGTLSALADALRDQGMTRKIAEALDQGNVAGAADALRELADQMGEVSPATREALADALREAARTIQRSRPDLADQMRATADALQFGDSVAGAAGLEALADALERQPSSSASIASGGGGEGNALGSQRREQPFRPSGVEGTPLELTTDGQGQLPTTGTPGEQTTNAQTGTPIIRSGGFGNGGPVQAADDPLQIPTDVRDVVRNYFSP
jgi:hypothetical protein